MKLLLVVSVATIHYMQLLTLSNFITNISDALWDGSMKFFISSKVLSSLRVMEEGVNCRVMTSTQMRILCAFLKTICPKSKMFK